MNKITKEMVDKLSNPDISKREYDSIVSLIYDRVGDIWRDVLKISKRKLHWYAFSNDVELGHGNGSTGEEFDPVIYKDWIEMTGECDYVDNEFYEYNDGFPTSFLWTEDGVWQKEVLNNFEDSIKKTKLKKDTEKVKREEKKKKRLEIMKIIKGKLSKEELKYITFK